MADRILLLVLAMEAVGELQQQELSLCVWVGWRVMEAANCWLRWGGRWGV